VALFESPPAYLITRNDPPKRAEKARKSRGAAANGGNIPRRERGENTRVTRVKAGVNPKSDPTNTNTKANTKENTKASMSQARIRAARDRAATRSPRGRARVATGIKLISMAGPSRKLTGHLCLRPNGHQSNRLSRYQPFLAIGLRRRRPLRLNPTSPQSIRA